MDQSSLQTQQNRICKYLLGERVQEDELINLLFKDGGVLRCNKDPKMSSSEIIFTSISSSAMFLTTNNPTCVKSFSVCANLALHVTWSCCCLRVQSWTLMSCLHGLLGCCPVLGLDVSGCSQKTCLLPKAKNWSNCHTLRADVVRVQLPERGGADSKSDRQFFHFTPTSRGLLLVKHPPLYCDVADFV